VIGRLLFRSTAVCLVTPEDAQDDDFRRLTRSIQEAQPNVSGAKRILWRLVTGQSFDVSISCLGIAAQRIEDPLLVGRW
jgi:hypothetical protein